MKTIKLLITISLMLMLSIQAEGQRISGKVTASTNGSPVAGAKISLKGTTTFVYSGPHGNYSIEIDAGHRTLVFSFTGFKTREVKVAGRSVVNVQLTPEVKSAEELIICDNSVVMEAEVSAKQSLGGRTLYNRKKGVPVSSQYYVGREQSYMQHNTEGYAPIEENGFKKVSMNPLSTFSVDVDGASYSNIRRFISNGSLPPKDAVRVEEMINYFNYDYPQPKGEVPFGIYTELAACPWNEEHLLMHVGLQGRKIATENLPPSNIVFLIDVSGSMSSANKLPLLKSSFNLLTEQLRREDRIAIVVYAGSSGLVLPSTSGKDKQKIKDALNNLHAGGSTAGGEGLKLAYKVAEENFLEEGNNRIILATDGDFNVGPSSNGEMQRLIEKERKKGIAISVLGFGMGNYKDDKMEIIANKGNGNYSYIDNLMEAKKVLVSEFGGTLFTIAKDVKFQLEFNPAKVESYRLIGYENRLLNEEDFEDDKKDAGEIGAGHTVTALYEIVPAKRYSSAGVLKYQSASLNEKAKKSNELLTMKLRYKEPDGYKSKLIEQAVTDAPESIRKTSDNFRFSAAVASFGMLLRGSEFKGSCTYESAVELAESAKGKDTKGYRGEMIRLVKSAGLLSNTSAQR
mgnify:CR=1 FL=1